MPRGGVNTYKTKSSGSVYMGCIDTLCPNYDYSDVVATNDCKLSYEITKKTWLKFRSSKFSRFMQWLA